MKGLLSIIRDLIFRRVVAEIRQTETKLSREIESTKLMMGTILSGKNDSAGSISSIHDVEFQVFSQFGDDGIIQWLTNKLQIQNETFVEFGVEDFRESNTRFLMAHSNWSGLVIDGSENNISSIRNSEYFWKHDLQAVCAFIKKDNINDLITNAGFTGEIGLLSIDLDGNDYWIWECIDAVSPVIIIVEYNSVFGIERAISTPYDPDFYRTEKHFSNIYFGASLKALLHLAQLKGYVFLGSNSAGNNAYFVKKDRWTASMPSPTPEMGYVESKFRESRDIRGTMDYVRDHSRAKLISGMPVINVITGEFESF